jgi:hypothetical protein
LEAVSNNINMLVEPRVPNGRRTMLYMATSLAFTAGGIILVVYSAASHLKGKQMVLLPMRVG